jgi:hypothetical protein
VISHQKPRLGRCIWHDEGSSKAVMDDFIVCTVIMYRTKISKKD